MEQNEINDVIAFLKEFETEDEPLHEMDYGLVDYLKDGDASYFHVGDTSFSIKVYNDGELMADIYDKDNDQGIITPLNYLKKAIKSLVNYKIVAVAPKGWKPYQRQKMMCLFDPNDDDLIFVKGISLFGAIETNKNKDLLTTVQKYKEG